MPFLTSLLAAVPRFEPVPGAKILGLTLAKGGVVLALRPVPVTAVLEQAWLGDLLMIAAILYGAA